VCILIIALRVSVKQHGWFGGGSFPSWSSRFVTQCWLSCFHVESKKSNARPENCSSGSHKTDNDSNNDSFPLPTQLADDTLSLWRAQASREIWRKRKGRLVRSKSRSTLHARSIPRFLAPWLLSLAHRPRRLQKSISGRQWILARHPWALPNKQISFETILQTS
jgi:hypothetical protein